MFINRLIAVGAPPSSTFGRYIYSLDGFKKTTRNWGGHHLVDTNHNLLATEHIHDPFLCEVQSAPRPFAHR